MGVWLLIVLLACCTLALSAKLFLLRRDLRGLAADLHDHLHTDSNTLLTSDSRDPALRAVAATLNDELAEMRRQRLRYENGDRELKQAVTNISHDLRTPLTAINGYLDLLEGEEKSAAAARYLALIENRTDAMTRLTEELFRYSVILAEEEPLARETVVLNDALAESLASFYGALTSRGITPQIEICDARVTRLLDKDALARVLANILNNALKYSDGDLAVQLDEDGTLYFSNHAAALDEVSTAQLFDRFFTVENARHSTGLGLSIAKSLTEQMHGEISAAYSDSLLMIRLRFNETEVFP